MIRTYLVALDVEAECDADMPTLDELATSLSCVLTDGPEDEYRWGNSTLYGTLDGLTRDAADGAFPHLFTDEGVTASGPHVAHWAFTDHDNDLAMFSRTYDHEPTEDEVRRDGHLWYRGDGGGAADEAGFQVWHDGLCEPGLVSIVPLRRPT